MSLPFQGDVLDTNSQPAGIGEILQRYRREEASLIMILQDLQREYRYLPVEKLRAVADYLAIPLSHIYSVATFYKAFSIKPRGKTIIKICKGTSCHVRGAQLIEDELLRQLQIKAGETTPDLGFTVEIVNCVGACAMAPVVVTNEKFIGEMAPDKVAKLLENGHEN